MQERPVAPAQDKWLSIIGVGEDGVEGLSAAARQRIEAAGVVFGGSRHLDLVADLINGEVVAWPRPIKAAVSDIAGRRGTPVAVLVSGDPFLHSMGSIIADAIPAGEFEAYPAPSAFSLAAARLGWAIQDCDTVSLCGNPVEILIPYLQPGRRLLVLSSDDTTPKSVASLLGVRGFGASVISVLERLGGSAERIREQTADTFDVVGIDRLNMMAIAVAGSAKAQVIPQAPGLDDYLFENDGMLTKREIRAMTLSSLAPRAGDLLWDIGTGSGAVAIEWLLAHPANRAIAIEHHEDRAALAQKNAAALGVPHLQVVIGRAPAALADLENPQAIFIGGGLSQEGVFEAAWDRLQSGGRLVANSVTMESDAVLTKAVGETGGALTRASIERLDQIGRMHGYRPAMTVTQLRAIKP